MRNKVIVAAIAFITFCCAALGIQRKVNGATNNRVDALIKSLSHKDAAVRIKAVEGLGKMRSAAKDAVPYLNKATGDKDPKVRSAAALALFRIGPAAMKSVSWMSKIGLEPITTEIATQAFDETWETVNREYPMFVLKSDVDWDKLREKYRPEAINAQSDTELVIIIADMISHLRDIHTGVKVRGKGVPVYRRDYKKNWNRNVDIYRSLVGQLQKAGERIMWTKTKDKIGWIVISEWYGWETPDHFDNVLEEMRDTRGLIVDVRSNGGGDSWLAAMVAGRFVDRPRTYLYYRHRNGPRRTDLTEKIPQQLIPRGPWRYDRPVILLMGQKCLSANESFCAQMSVCPQVTTMGDHTRGSTGFPVWFKLPARIEVWIPQWLAYLPDGQVFDERGVQPDVLFEGTANSFTGDRDELMSMALEHLRKAPLPATPITGPTIQSAREKEEIERISQPKVVSVEPANGAENIEPDAKLRIRFDRPMRPSTVQMEWEEGSIDECDEVEYDKDKNEFIILAKLQPGCKHRIVINPPNPDGMQYGFQSVYGVPAESYEWTFTAKSRATGTHRKSEFQAHTEDAQESVKLLTIIEELNRNRRGIKSLEETIKTVELSRPGQSGFRALRTYRSDFRLQNENQYMADVSDVLGMPFVIFAEGAVNDICGFYQKTKNDEKVVFCHLDNITEQNVQIADPFDSKTKDASSVIRDKKLTYGGSAEIEGRMCYIVSSYTGESSLPARRWWIDKETNLPVQVVSNEDTGTRKVNRFAFDKVNDTLSYSAFTPGVIPYQLVVKIRKQAEPLGEGYTDRFIEIKDISGGYVSARWGKYGPKGKISIGLK